MAPVTSPAPTMTSLPPSPTRSRKRPHPNDENVSPSQAGKNSPAKLKNNISSGLVSIRNYFLPISNVEISNVQEETADQCSSCTSIPSNEFPSPAKKLKSSTSTSTVATPAQPAGTVSFITSTPKRTTKQLNEQPRTKDSPTTTPSNAGGASNSPSRNILDSFNSFFNKSAAVSSATTKSLLDIFSPLRSSLTRTESLIEEEECHEDNLRVSITEEVEIENKSTASTQSEDEYYSSSEVVQYYEETSVTVEEVVEEVFNPYRFMKTLPPAPDTVLSKPPALPPKNVDDKRLTLVLDLDETLVHCSTEQFGVGESDYEFEVTFGGTDYHVFARKRPFLEEFFRRISGKYEVVVFTASQQVYADKLLDLLGASKYVHHRLFRDSCVYFEGYYL